MSATTVEILLIIFFSTLVRSTFGFGEALIAVPLLAFIMPVEIATPLAVLLSITVAAIVIVQDWRNIHMRATGWLLLPTCLGIPLGIALLTMGHQFTIKVTLALIIIGFSVFSLFDGGTVRLHSDNRGWLLGCGFLAGVFGGAYGMNGPPLVVYGAMRGWSPQHFRATLQGYFLPAGILSIIGFWLGGLWIPEVTHYYLLSLPAAIPAIILGRTLNHRLRPGAFLRYVYIGLIGTGILLLAKATLGP